MLKKRSFMILAILVIIGAKCYAVEFKPETMPRFTYFSAPDSSFSRSKRSAYGLPPPTPGTSARQSVAPPM
ncbi:MAG: hypothetical protein KBC96_03670 [Armatimonadetes bacterium]|nr:hypothetical protein [Armatimonadota bacterium]